MLDRDRTDWMIDVSTTATLAKCAPAHATGNVRRPHAMANSDITTTSPGHIFSATPRSLPGARTCAAQRRRASLLHGRTGDALPAVGRFLWLLATRAGRLNQPPTGHACGLDPRDRLLCPIEASSVFWNRSRRSSPAAGMALTRMIRSASECRANIGTRGIRR
jgi:hypothetical protein